MYKLSEKIVTDNDSKHMTDKFYRLKGEYKHTYPHMHLKDSFSTVF